MKKGRLLLTIALLMGICTLCAAQENEAYAVYNESNKRLVSCYDENRDKKTGETFDLNTGLELPGWHDKEIVSVSFHSTFSEVRPTTTRAWFEGQTSLVEISGIKYLNTSEVTDMGWMFFFCSSLESIDTRFFDTSKVINMSSMFCGCNGLTKLNLNSFNTSNVTNMENMFKDCSNLKTIFVNPSWNTGKVSESNSMFEGCAYLKGGAGTIYDSNKTDDEYARIDGGPENPGYFTYKKPAGITTGIDEAMPSSSMFNVQCDSWFTIDGRKLSGKPAKKGVYIHNGRAVVN